MPYLGLRIPPESLERLPRNLYPKSLHGYNDTHVTVTML